MKIIKLLSCVIILFFIYNIGIRAENFWGTIPSYPTESIRAMSIDSNKSIIASKWGTALLKSTNDGGTWTEIQTTGLTNLFVNAIEIAPNRNIWVATYGGGVFKSTDNGASWTAKNNGLSNLFVKAITINRRGEIFIGTMGNGVYRSLDGGNTWTTSFSTMWYFDINALISVGDSAIVAGTSGEYVYRSTDNGNNWLKVVSGFQSKTITCFVKNPLDELFCGTLESGVYYSGDKGMSWARYYPNALMPQNISCIRLVSENEPIAGTSDSAIKRYSITHLQWRYPSDGILNGGVNNLISKSKDTLFASIPTKGIYKSTNQGLNWTKVYSGDTTLTACLGAYKNGIVFAGDHNNKLYKSTDYGISWNKLIFDDLKVNSIGFDSTGNVYVNAGIHLFRSNDMGGTWTAFDFGVFNKFSFAYSQSGALFAADSDLYRSTDNGASWTKLSVNSPSGIIFIGINNYNGDIYAPSVQGLKKSTDNGNTWSIVLGNNYRCNSIDFSSQGNVYVGTIDGLLISTNNGQNWTTKNFNIPDYPEITKVVVSDNDTVYIALKLTKHILKSRDNFQSYTNCGSGVNLTFVKDLCISSDGYLYIATDAVHRAAEPEYLIKAATAYPTIDTNGVDLSPTLSWKTTKDATMYELQVSKFNDFSDILEKVVINATEWKLVRPLLEYTKYFWRVRGKYNASMGQWSNLNYFSTRMRKPILKYPANFAKGLETTLKLLWYSVEGATDYTVQVAKDSNFTNIVVNQASIKDTTYQLKNLSLLTTYYWRVMAKANKAQSNWSDVWNFTTKLKAPILRTPPDKSVNLPIALTMTWDTSETATNYNIQIATDEKFEKMFFDGTTSEKNSHSLELLEYFTTYWWRLTAKNEYGSSNLSEAWKFTTVINQTQLIYPYDSLANLDAEQIFRWTKFDNSAVRYHIQIATDENFTNIFFEDSIVTKDTFLFSDLDYNGKFFWRIRTIVDENFGLWSETRVFWTGISRPVLKIPENNKIEVYPVTLDFRWNATPGAEYYYIELSKDPLFTNIVWFKDSLNLLTDRVYNLDGKTKYYWHVRASFKDGFSKWSDVWSFVTSDPNAVNEELVKERFNCKIYPNPFSSNFTVSYYLPENSAVKIELVDNSGKTVVNLLEQNQLSGAYNLVFQPQPLAAGIYFVKISFADETMMEKIIYIE